MTVTNEQINLERTGKALDADALAAVIDEELSVLPFAAWSATRITIGEHRGCQVQIVFTKDEDDFFDVDGDRRFIK